MRINKKIIGIFFLIFLLYAVGKIFFNDADPKAGFQTATMQYYYAFFSLLVLLLIFLKKRNKYRYPFFGLLMFAFIYYFFALFSSIYSNIVLLTGYNAIIGILYVVASVVLGQVIYSEKKLFIEQMNTLFNFLLFLIFTIILADMYFYFSQKGQTDFLINGVESGFSALLAIYYIFIKFIQYSHLLRRIKLFLIAPLILKLHSTSAILAFFPLYLYHLYKRKNFIQIIILILVIGIFGVYFINLLKSGIGELVVNNKPAEAYLSGSGRFILYTTAYETYISEYSLFEKVFGVGFAAERSMLTDKGLPWITDPHNAFILSIMGMGIIGSIIYLTFIIYPFIFLKRIRKYSDVNPLLVKYTHYWLYLHILFATFSMTGSYYIGKPSMLLIISLAFNYLLYLEYKKMKSLYA